MTPLSLSLFSLFLTMATSGHNGDPQPFSLDELENFNGDWVLSSDMRVSISDEELQSYRYH